MSSEFLPSASYTLLNLTEKLNNFNPGCQGRVIYHVFAPQREADFQPMHFWQVQINLFFINFKWYEYFFLVSFWTFFFLLFNCEKKKKKMKKYKLQIGFILIQISLVLFY